MGELLTIGEFARRTGLTRSALRFYDDCGLLLPASVDPGTGYRLYTPEQVEFARLLRECRQVGMPVAVTRRVLAAPEQAEELVVAFWSEAQAELAAKAAGVQKLIDRLKARVKMSGTWTVDGSDLAAAVGQVVPAAATDRGQPEVLRSVFIELGDEARLVATDRHRLAIRDLVVTSLAGDEEVSVLVDATALADVAGAIPRGPVALEIRPGGLRLCAEGWAKELPAVVGEYPAYRRLLTHEHEVSALVEVNALCAAIEAMVGEVAVVMEFEPEELRLRPPDAPAVASIPARVTGPPLVAGFNPLFLVDALRATEGSEVLIEGSTPVSPFVIRSASAGAFTTRVMPIKLK